MVKGIGCGSENNKLKNKEHQLEYLKYKWFPGVERLGEEKLWIMVTQSLLVRQ